MNNNRLFKDPILQQSFDTNGYVILPLLAKEEIMQLQNLFDSICPKNLKGIYSNIHDDVRENNMIVDTTIRHLFNKHLDHLLEGHELGMGTFLVKGTGPDSASTLHQDWSTVDESRFTACSIWCPLIDVDEKNGALQVIKGSHKLFKTYRSITIPSVYLDFDEELEPYLTTLPMKAGECVIYALNLFHGSKPNFTNTVRVSAVSGLFPKYIPLIHYYQNPEENGNVIDIYQIDKNFFYNGVREFYNGKRPTTLSLAGQINTNYKPLDKKTVFAVLRNHFPNIKPNRKKQPLTTLLQYVFRYTK
ncbi:hypothetical protein C7N43_00705 [Sphingobacteriales bacterium UPWRP_1]|nr:hypothetical protein B6N25_10440 [Sphingobacteriales bacterium TSM_CSS]PSJ78994.1 hypothetical protein C7N43_00705 [Sphingobacteriales bacterium UPWRP_1]